MKKGDRAFTTTPTRARTSSASRKYREAYPDPTDKTGKIRLRRYQGGQAAENADDHGRDQGRQAAGRHGAGEISRLSVQPVTAEEWKMVCKMGGL